MVLDAPDIYGLTAPRFPTQVLGLAWSLFALAAVWGVKGRVWPVGARAAYALSLVALGAFLLGFTRGDPMPLVSGFRLDVVGSALVLLASTAAWAWRVLRARAPAPPPQSESVANP
jgi:peptidoglycan/LPS O-acetylase OafA/YrhL